MGFEFSVDIVRYLTDETWGHDLEGLGVPKSTDGRDHQTRLNWLFNPVNTGLRLVDLVNYGLVLLRLKFPSEIFKSDLNP